MLTKQARIAHLSKVHRKLTNLNHYMDESWLVEAYRRTRKDGAVGVDYLSSKDYEENLHNNLKKLLTQAKSGTYKAPPVKRSMIPKPGSTESRPIGIPTFEDKILQRAVVMLLEPIYETDFLDCSHGFRPDRSAHDALQRLWENLTELGGCWLIDVDLRKFFDTLNHKCLREIIGNRIQDGVINRLIGKWLKAEVWESNSNHWRPEEGTPQGGVISPLLSNIYLHEVIDKWFYEIVQPRLSGRVFLIRFADDFVVGCEKREDAERFLAVLPKRLGKYGLSLHPEKTRIVEFKKPVIPDTKAKGTKTFDFLGFTHYWGKSRRGHPIVKRKTAKGRLNRSLKTISQWCREHRHDSLKDQYETLCLKLRGHYVYYGITGNGFFLSCFRQALIRLWHKWLNRRTRGNALPWSRFQGILSMLKLPYPRIYHSYVKYMERQPLITNFIFE